MGERTWGARRAATPEPQVAAADAPAARPGFKTMARRAVAGLARDWPFDAFMVARMDDRSWTAIAAATTELSADVGIPYPVQASLCDRLLIDRRPVLATDLYQHSDPVLRQTAQEYGVGAYAGVALRRPDGRRLGSICAYDPAPVHGDVSDLAARLHAAAGELAGLLAADLDALPADRAGSLERALVSADGMTHLPDRRGWAHLLLDEEERGRNLAEPAGLVVVDVGLVRTARAFRKAAQLTREVAGDVPLARVGGRELGLVCGGGDEEQVAALAAEVRARLRDAGYTATAGWAVREPGEDMLGTWWRAESAVVGDRRAVASP